MKNCMYSVTLILIIIFSTLCQANNIEQFLTSEGKIDLEKILNSKVDLVSSNGLSKYIKPIVDREKELIYAR